VSDSYFRSEGVIFLIRFEFDVYPVVCRYTPISDPDSKGHFDLLIKVSTKFDVLLAPYEFLLLFLMLYFNLQNCVGK
jgi:hypothetical protein